MHAYALEEIVVALSVGFNEGRQVERRLGWALALDEFLRDKQPAETNLAIRRNFRGA